MPRKTTVSLQRTVSPDRKYQSVLVQRLINKTMLDGKKTVAERAVYDALELAAKKLGIGRQTLYNKIKYFGIEDDIKKITSDSWKNYEELATLPASEFVPIA